MLFDGRGGTRPQHVETVLVLLGIDLPGRQPSDEDLLGWFTRRRLGPIRADRNQAYTG